MNKIAIQLSGQIRYWHKSYNDWVGFKASLEKEGFDVDTEEDLEIVKSIYEKL